MQFSKKYVAQPNMCCTLLIDKIVEDVLKTTDKTLQNNNHDGYYGQEY